LLKCPKRGEGTNPEKENGGIKKNGIGTHNWQVAREVPWFKKKR